MTRPDPAIWQQLPAEQRRQVIAILVQILLRLLTSVPPEAHDERGD